MKEAAAQFDKTYHSHRAECRRDALPKLKTGAVIKPLLRPEIRYVERNATPVSLALKVPVESSGIRAAHQGGLFTFRLLLIKFTTLSCSGC